MKKTQYRVSLVVGLLAVILVVLWPLSGASATLAPPVGQASTVDDVGLVEAQVKAAISIMETPGVRSAVSGFGILFGYFFFYGIRHGTRTQETFKGFLGLLGVSGTATGLGWVLGDPRLVVLMLYPFAVGCLQGFGIYAAVAVILASIRASGGEWARWAEALSRTLLGEDWTEKPPLGSATQGGGRSMKNAAAK